MSSASVMALILFTQMDSNDRLKYPSLKGFGELIKRALDVQKVLIRDSCINKSRGDVRVPE